MSDEIESMSNSIDTMKDNTLISSQLDPLKDGMNQISSLSLQISQLKNQFDNIKKVTDAIERRESWMEDSNNKN